MKRVYWELLASMVFVLGGTFFAYGELGPVAAFWDAQSLWSAALFLGWMVVSAGYFHQGWMVHHGHTSLNVSAFLPATVFVVQCILFVKGIYFHDWSLIGGALIVNSGVAFSLYQIMHVRRV